MRMRQWLLQDCRKSLYSASLVAKPWLTNWPDLVIFTVMNFIPVHPRLNFVTLCAYAQQCYAFGRVGLCAYMYIYIYVCQQKNRLFSALPLENLLLSVMGPCTFPPSENRYKDNTQLARVSVMRPKSYYFGLGFCQKPIISFWILAHVATCARLCKRRAFSSK